MRLPYSIQHDARQTSIQGHFMLLLATLGVSIFLPLISGGVPPIAWRLLFSTITQFSTLWQVQGSALLLPLVIVVIQSLALAGAWGLLLWFAWREGRDAFEAISDARSAYSPQPISLADLDDFALSTAPTPGDHSSSPLLRAAPSATLLDDPGILAPTPSKDKLDDILNNPFEEPEDEPAPVSRQPVNPRKAVGEKDETWLQSSGHTNEMLFYTYASMPTAAGSPPALPEETVLPLAALQEEAQSSSPGHAASSSHPLLLVHGVTHPGIVRARKPNEDSFVATVTSRKPPFQPAQAAALLLVADGMGGHNNGKFASSLVIDVVRSETEQALQDPLKSDDDLKDCLVNAVLRANARLYNENQQFSTLRGTTLTGALLLEQLGVGDRTFTAHVVNVGDSRTYWYSRAQGFTRVTRDHSTVEELIAHGEITPEERYTHKRRNEIYRCLGDEPTVEVDEFTVSLQPGDSLLVCSDGLWEMVFDDKLAQLMAMPTDDPAYLTDLFIQAALDGGGQDNVSAVVALTS